MKVHILDEGGATANATSTANVIAVVDLTVTKTDNHGGSSQTSTRGSFTAGTVLTYTIVVSNSGPSKAVGYNHHRHFPGRLYGDHCHRPSETER